MGFLDSLMECMYIEAGQIRFNRSLRPSWEVGRTWFDEHALRAELSTELQQWILDFDQRKEVHPISFPLEVISSKEFRLRRENERSNQGKSTKVQ